MIQRVKNLCLRFFYWGKRLLGLLPISDLQQLWENNEKAQQRLKVEWDKEHRANNLIPCELLQAHKAASGNVYYIYKQLQQMPIQRYQELTPLELQLEYCFDDAHNFDTALSLIQTELDANNLQRAKVKFAELMTRKRTMPSAFILQQMCALFMVRHDENPYYLDPTIQQQKIYELQTDSQLSGFFLTFCWEIWLLQRPRLTAKFGYCNVIYPQDLVHYSATQTIAQNQKQSANK